MNETEQYLAWVGQQVLQQQAAQQQQAKPAETQEMRNSRIVAERNRAAQSREIQAARERAARFQVERAKEAADARRIADVMEEHKIMEAEKQKFLAVTGNMAEDFDRTYNQRWQAIQQERANEAQRRMAEKYGSLF